MIPNSLKINRGKRSLRDLADFMIRRGYTRLIIIEGWKGNPRRLKFYSLLHGRLENEATILLSGLSLQVDKKMNRKLKTLSIEDDGADTSKKLKEYIVDFLGSHYIIDPRRDGVDGKMLIRVIDGSLVIEFYGDRKDIIYPRIKVEKWFVNTK